MNVSNRSTLAAAIAFAIANPAAHAADAPAGQILFVSGAVKIVDAKGIERDAKKGDRIGPEEHVVTGAGAIGQIKMPDGGLIGVRPDSDLRFDQPKAGDASGERVVFLSKGAVRIVNVEGGRDRPLPMLLQTPTASIGLRNADNESIVVPPRGATGPNPAADPGTYSRMAAGGGIMRTSAGETPLAPSQSAFAGGAGLPARIAALPDGLIRSSLPASPAGATPGNLGGTALAGRNIAPVIGPIALGGLPAGGDAGLRLPSPGLAPVTIAPINPVGVGAISPIIILPIKPPTLVDTGSIDISSLPPTKLATLPPTTLAQLPTATLNTLSPAALATLPPNIIKGLAPGVQATVTPLLSVTQQNAVTAAVAPPPKITTVIPISTTTRVRTRF